MSLGHTFTFRCSVAGCTREDLIVSTVSEIHARTTELGWVLHTQWIRAGGIDVCQSADVCPNCAARGPAEGGAPSTPSLEPAVGRDSGDCPTAAPPGTLPAPPPAVPVGGDLVPPATSSSSLSFRTPAGATGIGPGVGRQPASFPQPEATVKDRRTVATAPEPWHGRVDTAGMTEEPS